MKQRTDGRYCETMMINGRRKWFYGTTKAEVLRKIREYSEEKEKGPLLEAVADAWHEERIRHVRYKTAEAYTRPLAEIKEEFGRRHIRTITAPEITQWIRELEHKGYARRTVQLRLDVLRMICRYAIAELGVMTDNPVTSVRLSEGLPKGTRELPSSEDLRLIAEHRLDDRFSLLPFLLVWSGLRLGEALALRDTSFADGYMEIDAQVSWEPNKGVLAPVKTSKGVRRVAILDVLRDALPEWTGFLFSMNGDGKEPLSKSAFTKRWKAYAERTGVMCDRHSLRHEYATVLFDAKVDTKVAAEMMGHDEAVMRDIYTHIRESRRTNKTAALNRYASRKFVKMLSDKPADVDI
jgi:integrase